MNDLSGLGVLMGKTGKPVLETRCQRHSLSLVTSLVIKFYLFVFVSVFEDGHMFLWAQVQSEAALGSFLSRLPSQSSILGLAYSLALVGVACAWVPGIRTPGLTPV